MTGHIYIYGEIGKQVTLDTVLKEITPKNSEYHVHIISPGGDVFEGYAIYNAIKNTGKKITVYIEGRCASIATLLAATGEKIIMNTKSAFMIHNPRVMNTAGDAKELRNVAGQLETIKTQLIDSWAGRTTLSREQLSQMYDHETWLTPEQAVEFGFADEVQEVIRAVAFADIKKINMENKKTLIGKIEKMINDFFSPKSMTDTLADGTVITVESEDGDWTGKKVYKEDGTPLAPGEYTLEGGRKFTVAEDETIETVTEPEAQTQEKPEDMDKKTLDDAVARATAAEARIKELESALEARNQVAEQAEARAKTFENKLNVDLKMVQDELSKIKNTTVGDTTPPKLAEQKAVPGAVTLDPMQAWFKQNILDKRNTD